MAVLASLDVVIGSLVLGTTRGFATYQAANILGRVPVFIGTALSVVVFTRMITVHRAENVICESVGLYIKVCVPLTLVTASLPPQIMTAVFPARYGDVGAVLPWTALAGLVMGAVNLATTYFQAAGRYRRVAALLGTGVLVAAPLDVLGLKAHGTIGLAMAVATGAAAVTVALAREIRSVWPGALRGALRTLTFVSLCCLPCYTLRDHLIVRVLWAAGCGALFGARALLDASHSGSVATGAVRPRVLHLGYEDPKRPGAGGGSVRTYEVNRRLCERFDITVVCARYRGCRARTEDGVRYVHAGLAVGDFPARLAYFAALPWTLFRYRSDLVVEDFGAPFSTVVVPWLTSRPVIGLVQWLFAVEKSRQYHLPFAWGRARRGAITPADGGRVVGSRRRARGAQPAGDGHRDRQWSRSRCVRIVRPCAFGYRLPWAPRDSPEGTRSADRVLRSRRRRHRARLAHRGRWARPRRPSLPS